MMLQAHVLEFPLEFPAGGSSKKIDSPPTYRRGVYSNCIARKKGSGVLKSQMTRPANQANAPTGKPAQGPSGPIGLWPATWVAGN